MGYPVLSTNLYKIHFNSSSALSATIIKLVFVLFQGLKEFCVISNQLITDGSSEWRRLILPLEIIKECSFTEEDVMRQIFVSALLHKLVKLQ